MSLPEPRSPEEKLPADSDLLVQALPGHGTPSQDPDPAAQLPLPLEDLLGVDEQPNLPGTIDGHPNWRRRFAAPVRELLDDSDAARRLEMLACARLQAAERDQ